MRVIPCLLSLLFCAAPAAAQSVFERAAGVYGLPDHPEASCAANPHRIEFSANPPHAFFSWANPIPGPDGQMRDHARYDILDFDDQSITLRREGEQERAADGGPVLWIFRLTTGPDGYCWGRKDWPSVRCVAPASRCDGDAATS